MSEPNYLVGCLVLAACAVVVTIGERPFLKRFLRLWAALVAFGIASVVLSSILRRLDIAFGKNPWLLLAIIVVGVVLIPKATKRFRNRRADSD